MLRLTQWVKTSVNSNGTQTWKVKVAAQLQTLVVQIDSAISSQIELVRTLKSVGSHAIGTPMACDWLLHMLRHKSPERIFHYPCCKQKDVVLMSIWSPIPLMKI